mgnify:CR=1 FL=1|tara:strand:+ start:472 stop:1362 length:891 start_codon:yes stop_codon:yes gene_type:complete
MLIYEAKNKLNNKVFIGHTSMPLHRAIACKVSQATNKNPNYNSPFSKALRKYGINKFIFTEIDKSFSRKELNKLKSNYIKQYNSMDRQYGYNCQSGQDRGFSVSEDVCKKISEIHKGKVEPRSRNIKRSITMKKQWKNPTKKMLEDSYNKKHQLGSRDIRGEKNPMYGVHRFGEDNPMYGIRGELHSNYGKKLTDEQKKNLSDKAKIRHAKRRIELIEKYKDMTEKRCSKCKKIKKVDMFSKSKRKLDGYLSACKDCERIRAREKYYRKYSPNKITNRYGELIRDLIKRRESGASK